MKAILLDMFLYVHRTAYGSTFRATEGGLVVVNALMGLEAALIRQEHGTHLACLCVTHKTFQVT